MPRSSGFVGIDIAYLTALFGTMVANCIYIIGGKVVYLTQLHFFVIFDFFPALFFFLNGMTVTLTMRDKRISNHRLLSYLGKRGTVLFLVGFVFAGKWPVNLFVASGLFFVVAPFIARLSNMILRSIAVAILLFTIILVNIGIKLPGEFSLVFLHMSDFKNLGTFFFFNGYYSLLPWVIFFIMGMVHGRAEMRPKGFFPPSSIIGLGLIAFSFIAESFSKVLYMDYEQIETFGFFPFNIKLYFPSFVIFISGACILFVNVVTYLFMKMGDIRWVEALQSLAASKYSVYFFLMFFSFVLSSGFNLVLLSKPSVLIFLTVTLISLSVWATVIWKKRLNTKAPMEWLIKYISGSTK